MVKPTRTRYFVIALAVVLAIAVVAHAQSVQYINGSYVILFPNDTLNPVLQYLLNLPVAPVGDNGILVQVPNWLMSNVTIVTGYFNYEYLTTNYSYITPLFTSSGLPSGLSQTYITSNATLKFTGNASSTASNVELAVNFTMGPWNYIWSEGAVYGAEDYYGNSPVLWVPITIFNSAGSYNWTIYAFITYPNGTTVQVPMMSQITNYEQFVPLNLNPWNPSGYGGFWSTGGAATSNGSTTIGVGVPIGPLLYNASIPVNITIEVIAYYNISTTTNVKLGVGLTGTPSSFVLSSVYVADYDSGYDGYDVTSPLFIPNMTCFFNVVNQQFMCAEGPYYMPISWSGFINFNIESTSGGWYTWFIEYPYYFYRFGDLYYYYIFSNGTSEWQYSSGIGGLGSWWQTAPSYFNGRLWMMIGNEYNYPSVPVYQWEAIYTYTAPFTPPMNLSVLELFYANYTSSDLANRLSFNVTGIASTINGTVSIDNYSLWAKIVNLAGSGSVCLNNTLSSGYSYAIVLNTATMSVVDTYNITAGGSVCISIPAGSKYLIINMIPPQYNATFAPSLNLTSDPYYYPFAYSFDPAAQVIYVNSTVPTQYVYISLNSTVFPLLINATVYEPTGTVNSTLIDLTNYTELAVPLSSNVTLRVVSVPSGYVLNPTQEVISFMDISSNKSITYGVLPQYMPVIINSTAYPVVVNVTLTAPNGTSHSWELTINASSLLNAFTFGNASFTVVSYPSNLILNPSQRVITFVNITTPKVVGYAIIPPNYLVIQWGNYSIPSNYMQFFTPQFASQFIENTTVFEPVLLLPPLPLLYLYNVTAIDLVPPSAGYTGYTQADIGDYFTGYVSGVLGVGNSWAPYNSMYIQNSLATGYYLFYDFDFIAYNYTIIKRLFLDKSAPYLVPPLYNFSIPLEHYYQYMFSFANTNATLPTSNVFAVSANINISPQVTEWNAVNATMSMLIPLNTTIYIAEVPPSVSPLILSTTRYKITSFPYNVTVTCIHTAYEIGTISYNFTTKVTVYGVPGGIVAEVDNLPYEIEFYSNCSLEGVELYTNAYVLIQMFDTEVAQGNSPFYVSMPITITIPGNTPFTSVYNNYVIKTSTDLVPPIPYFSPGAYFLTTPYSYNYITYSTNITLNGELTRTSTNSTPIFNGEVSMLFTPSFADTVDIYGYDVLGPNTGYYVASSGFPISGPSWGLVLSLTPSGISNSTSIIAPVTSNYVPELTEYTYNIIIKNITNFYESPIYNWIMNALSKIQDQYYTQNITNTYITDYIIPAAYNIATYYLMAGGIFAAPPISYNTAGSFPAYSIGVSLSVPGPVTLSNPWGIEPQVVAPYWSSQYKIGPGQVLEVTTWPGMGGIINTTTLNAVLSAEYPYDLYGVYNSFAFSSNLSLPIAVNNPYGGFMIPIQYPGNLTPVNVAITASVPLSELGVNTQYVQVGTLMLGLLNGTMMATYKVGPYTYIEMYTATPIPNRVAITIGSIGGEIVSFPVMITTETITMYNGVVINATVVTVNETYSIMPSGTISLAPYSLPVGVLSFSVFQLYWLNGAIGSPSVPGFGDSVILPASPSDTLYVSYSIKSYPVKIALNQTKTVVYYWYQGPNAINITYTNIINFMMPLYVKPIIYAIYPAKVNNVATYCGLLSWQVPLHLSWWYMNYESTLICAQNATLSSTYFPTMYPIYAGFLPMTRGPSAFATRGLLMPLINLLYPTRGMALPIDTAYLGVPLSAVATYTRGTIAGAYVEGRNYTLYSLMYPMLGSGTPRIPQSVSLTYYGPLSNGFNTLIDISTEYIPVSNSSNVTLICVYSRSFNASSGGFTIKPAMFVGIYYEYPVNNFTYFIPLFQGGNITSVCFVPVNNGTYFILGYIPPQVVIRSLVISPSYFNTVVARYLPPVIVIRSLFNGTKGAGITLINLANNSFATDYYDVLNPSANNVFWMVGFNTTSVTAVTNLTAIKLLFPNVTVTPLTVTIVNGTPVTNGTGVIVTDVNATGSTTIYASNNTVITKSAIVYMGPYFSALSVKVLLNKYGIDLTGLVARLGLPIIYVNGTPSTSPFAIISMSSNESLVNVCQPSFIGTIQVVNATCFSQVLVNGTVTTVVEYVRLPVNLNVTAVNNGGKLTIELTATDVFGNPVIEYPVSISVSYGNTTYTATAVISNGKATVNTPVPYSGNTYIYVQSNGTAAYLPASTAYYVPITTPLAINWISIYIGSIWWLLVLIILILLVLLVLLMVLEKRRSQRRMARMYMGDWV